MSLSSCQKWSAFVSILYCPFNRWPRAETLASLRGPQWSMLCKGPITGYVKTRLAPSSRTNYSVGHLFCQATFQQGTCRRKPEDLLNHQPGGQ